MEHKKHYQITEFCHRFLADHIKKVDAALTLHAAMEMIQNSSAGWPDRPGKCMALIYRKRQWNGQKKGLRGPGMRTARNCTARDMSIWRNMCGRKRM